MADRADGFIDIDRLLAADAGGSRGNALWWWVALVGLAVGAAWISLPSAEGDRTISPFPVFSAVLMLALLGGLMLLSVMMARGQAMQAAQLESADESIRLKRWPHALQTLQSLLSGRVRHPGVRAQGLLSLAAVLARYDRFEEASKVYDHLLDRVAAGEIRRAAEMGRAMSMLRMDHLTDAYAAIQSLKRSTGDTPSAGLALLEIYRDVKTGHPQEAIERFQSQRSVLQSQMGYRVADAYALTAAAHDALSRTSEALAAWADATTLCAGGELVRRYPELAATARKYPSAPVPPGVIQ